MIYEFELRKLYVDIEMTSISSIITIIVFQLFLCTLLVLSFFFFARKIIGVIHM